jgi:hypothetical protein
LIKYDNLNGGMLEGEGERSWEFTYFQTFLEEEGLFERETPEGDDPAGFPIRVMGKLHYNLAMGAYRNRHNKVLAEKLTAWKQSLKKVRMSYEIIAYPRLEGLGYTLGVKDLIRDAIAHSNEDTKERPHRAPIELHDAELKVLGRLTQVRDLPFDPNKRVYQYAELAPLREAEHLLTDIEWKARGGQINPGGQDAGGDR